MTDLGSREQLNQTYSEYSRAFKGVVIGHEYLHTMQRVILGERWFQQAYNPPSWFNEGMAVFMENAAANHSTFDAFMQFRSVESAIMYPDCPYTYCVKIEKEQVQSFLSIYKLLIELEYLSVCDEISNERQNHRDSCSPEGPRFIN
jgi:hypothetical protein